MDTNAPERARGLPRVLLYNGAGAEDMPQPFRAESLRDLGCNLTWPRRARVLPRKLRDAIHHRYDVQIDRPGLVALSRSDLVIAYLEPNIGYPALLRTVPGSPARRVPLVSIVCWAAEDLMNGTSQRKLQVKRILKASDLVCFFSENQRQVFVDHGIPPARLAVVPFGVERRRDTDDSLMSRSRPISWLSVGWDRGRDYVTLAEAVRGTDHRVVVVARAEDLRGLDLPGQVELRGTVGREQYFELLADSSAVVIPTRALQYPTGQSVAMEAAAAGCAVVISDTAAMRDYFTPGVTALMPEVGNARALREAMSTLAGDDGLRHRLASAAHDHVLASHLTDHMWRAVVAAVKEAGLLPLDPLSA